MNRQTWGAGTAELARELAPLTFAAVEDAATKSATAHAVGLLTTEERHRLADYVAGHLAEGLRASLLDQSEELSTDELEAMPALARWRYAMGLDR